MDGVIDLANSLVCKCAPRLSCMPEMPKKKNKKDKKAEANPRCRRATPSAGDLPISQGAAVGHQWLNNTPSKCQSELLI